MLMDSSGGGSPGGAGSGGAPESSSSSSSTASFARAFAAAPDGHEAASMPSLRGARIEKRETLHLFQPPRADQMPDPFRGRCHNVRLDSL